MKQAAILLAPLLLICSCASFPDAAIEQHPSSTRIDLPAVRLSSECSVEEALLNRRSVREYSAEALSLQEASQLLWAAQGVTAEWGGRTAPSAGALYPVRLYLSVARVHGLATGFYRYEPAPHALILITPGDTNAEISTVALGQPCILQAAAILVLSAAYDQTTAKYGERGIRYVQTEAGHAGQNVYLQAEALNLGCVVVGAFDDEALGNALGLPAAESPLYLIPVGRRIGGN